jgi:hypothetical protein
MLHFLMFGSFGVLFRIFFLVVRVTDGNGWFAGIFFSFVLVVCALPYILQIFAPVSDVLGRSTVYISHVLLYIVPCTLAPKPHPTSYVY